MSLKEIRDNPLIAKSVIDKHKKIIMSEDKPVRIYNPKNTVSVKSKPIKKRKKKVDLVNFPPHYRPGDPYETINVIEAWRLGYHLGNAVKYISRAGHKDPKQTIRDLEKGQWYLNKHIENLKSNGSKSK